MRLHAFRPSGTAIALCTLLAAGAAQAQLAITEVAPWSSGNSLVNADWIEITNFGSAAVDITGYKIDDASNSFATSVALRGVTSIAAGQSVIFFEGNASGSTDAAIAAAFNSVWGTSLVFGTSIGSYGGSGIGLSTGGDAVNLFTGAGVAVTGVSFGTSPTSAPYASFDNSAGGSGIVLTVLSAVGVNGAYLTASGNEIGSPASVVPEPGTWAMLLAGAGIVAGAVRRRRAA
jgi:hypothetical protein